MLNLGVERWTLNVYYNLQNARVFKISASVLRPCLVCLLLVKCGSDESGDVWLLLSNIELHLRHLIPVNIILCFPYHSRSSYILHVTGLVLLLLVWMAKILAVVMLNSPANAEFCWNQHSPRPSSNTTTKSRNRIQSRDVPVLSILGQSFERRSCQNNNSWNSDTQNSPKTELQGTTSTTHPLSLLIRPMSDLSMKENLCLSTGYHARHIGLRSTYWSTMLKAAGRDCYLLRPFLACHLPFLLRTTSIISSSALRASGISKDLPHFLWLTQALSLRPIIRAITGKGIVAPT